MALWGEHVSVGSRSRGARASPTRNRAWPIRASSRRDKRSLVAWSLPRHADVEVRHARYHGPCRGETYDGLVERVGARIVHGDRADRPDGGRRTDHRLARPGHRRRGCCGALVPSARLPSRVLVRDLRVRRRGSRAARSCLVLLGFRGSLGDRLRQALRRSELSHAMAERAAGADAAPPASMTTPSDADRAALWALLLAGGDGRRLRPLTRIIAGDDRPKQFCQILPGHTLLEVTERRVARVVPSQRTLVALTRAHERYYRPLLQNRPARALLVQPENRGTAPAILYGALRIAADAPLATVATFPPTTTSPTMHDSWSTS